MRILKRVPLDFDYPRGKIWYGYIPDIQRLKNNKEFIKQFPKFMEYNNTEPVCTQCVRKYGECSENTDYCIFFHNIVNLWKEEVPYGEGFQMWENTTEGSPQTPVFETYSELCEYCEQYCSFFGTNNFISKEKWEKALLLEPIFFN